MNEGTLKTGDMKGGGGRDERKGEGLILAGWIHESKDGHTLRTSDGLERFGDTEHEQGGKGSYRGLLKGRYDAVLFYFLKQVESTLECGQHPPSRPSPSPTHPYVHMTAVKARNKIQQMHLIEFFKYKCLNESEAETRNLSSASGADEETAGLSCPLVWDDVMCWPRTPAGVLAVQNCPSYLAGVNPQAMATKQCTNSGDWLFHQDRNKHWTNFSECTRGPAVFDFKEDTNVTYMENYFPIVKTISQAGYSISLVSLIIAFCILASFQRLRCPRNMLHLHLFMSFILRAFVLLLKDLLFVDGVGLPGDVVTLGGDTYFNAAENQNLVCKILTSLWQYFIMANYSWILMEGLYLHNLIFLALFSDTSSITIYVILGWGLPCLFVIPWVIVRATVDNNLCWTTNHGLYSAFLLIQIPTSAFVIINFFLFLNIIRVLLLKLRSSVSEETQTYRRWAKSTLVLVPLFGVHYAVFLGMSYAAEGDKNSTLDTLWLFADQLFACFQGFFVAVLYCFMNGEVRTELNKLRYRLQWSRLLTALRRGPGTHKSHSQGELFRRNNPRGSCYSSTSCTSLSGVQALKKWGGGRLGPPVQPINGRKRGSTPSCSQCTEQTRLSCCSQTSLCRDYIDGLKDSVVSVCPSLPFTGIVIATRSSTPLTVRLVNPYHVQQRRERN
uniref:Secretin receptor n=1 Tax=Timema douglasi TaxID=61478 RepID=A0A7R8VGD2_TIMDO|nr:unnamed protein product [Timema douglasi]